MNVFGGVFGIMMTWMIQVIEAYDILSLNCELLSERLKLIQLSKECPPDLISCIATLMYAAPRVDIPELLVVRKQFTSKFGKKFDENAMGNVGGILNERVVTKLSVQPPAAYLVQTYLEQICEKYEVDWTPNYRLSAQQMGEPMAPPSGFSVPIGQGTGLGHVAHTGMTVNGDDVTISENTLPPPQTNDFRLPTAPVQSIAREPSVPPAPMVPPSTLGSEMTNSKDDTKGDDGDDNDDGVDQNNFSSSDGPASSSGGKDSATYSDLAARFENLKNL